TWFILGTNVFVFLVDLVLGGALTEFGVKANDLIVGGQYWRLVTPIFLHGGLLHLGFNSYFLYLVGPQVERAFGTARYGAVYLLAGLAGSLASFALTPNPSLGASGALFGILGAFLVFIYRNQNAIQNSRAIMMQVVQVIGINLLFGFVVPLIDNWAHIGGLLGGAAAAWVASPRYVINLFGQREDANPEQQAWAGLTAVGLGLLTLTIFLIVVFSTFGANV
ncbi:MAG: rhomboid family intramembrane serine protease, partial [Chloroflexi bacterium]|nr:rhomboid family intramembrane serine protease [Chloroflexota bacterium]